MDINGNLKMENKYLEKIETLVRNQGEVLGEHSKMLLRIEKVIVGDPDAKIDGYGTRITRNEKYIEKDKKLKWTVTGFVLAIKAAVIYIIYKLW